MSQMSKVLQSLGQGVMDVESSGELLSGDLSTIEKDSIFQNYPPDGNPLHSTALDDDLIPGHDHGKRVKSGQDEQMPTPSSRVETPRPACSRGKRLGTSQPSKEVKKRGPQTMSPVFKTPSVPHSEPGQAKEKNLQRVEESPLVESQVTSSRTASTAFSNAAQTPTDTDSEMLTTDSVFSTSVEVSKSPVDRQEAVQDTDAREGSSTITKKRSRGQGLSPPLQVSRPQRQTRSLHGRVPLPDVVEEEEGLQGTSASSLGPQASNDSVTDEGSTYSPPKKKRSQKSLISSGEKKRKSGGSTVKLRKRGKKSKPSPNDTRRPSREGSSGSTDFGTQSKREKPKVQNLIDLEVVLEAFRDFVEQYKEKVDSVAVKKAIDHLSESFESQMMDVITATKELSTLKRKNMKLNAAINSKRSQLIDAKNELIQSEAKLRALEKEHRQTEDHLDDLSKAMTLLGGLNDLYTRYHAHCQEHPETTPTYGAASLPALLVESSCVMGPEMELRTVNERMQQVLDNVLDK